MNLYDEFSQVVAALTGSGIRFAVVGGVAMAFYDQPRFTRDIDFLVHSEDGQNLVPVMKELDYFESTRPWNFESVKITLRRFLKTAGSDFMSVDLLVSGSDEIDAIIEDAESQPWESMSVKIARKKDLIWLKKKRGSDQDLVDIRKLENDKT